MNPLPPVPAENQPTRRQALLFWGKAWMLRLRRWLQDPNGRPRPLLQSPLKDGTRSLAESRSALYSSTLPAEFALQAGKVQNLRVAAGYLHGRVLRTGELFSFWAHVPRPTVRRGFAPGRELREGCVIPNTGGGLCQLTNALYDAALTAGFEIVERHAHSRRLPGSMAAAGHDATIFWNYVDLRFRSPVDCQLDVRLNRSELRVAFRKIQIDTDAASVPGPEKERFAGRSPGLDDARPVESCETCGVTGCFRHPAATGLSVISTTAWLVDAWWPEHDAWMTSNRQVGDTLLVPLEQRRWKVGPYRWNSRGFANVRSAPLFVLRRSWISRRLAAQGAARQRALLRMDRELAEIYAKRIPCTALHIVVSQNLLPFLWQTGALAGRTFDVMMTRLPLTELQTQLDRAAARWRESPTLSDFRADPVLLAAESKALAEARHWITPHRAIAEMAGCRAVLLDWKLPAVPRRARGTKLIFPCSTLARKGAHELRDAMCNCDVSLVLAGPSLECPDFWSQTHIEHAGEDWLNGAAAVVLPAWVESQPRRLLTAIAAGVPVICTEACGLGEFSGVTIIPEGDVDALRGAIETCLANPQRTPPAAGANLVAIP